MNLFQEIELWRNSSVFKIKYIHSGCYVNHFELLQQKMKYLKTKYIIALIFFINGY